MFKLCCIACVTVLASLNVAIHAAFVNPGFETGDFTGWTVGGNAEYGVALTGTPITGTAIPGNYVNAWTGAYAAWVKLGTTDPATTFTLEQTVPVAPGVTYQWGYSEGAFSTPPLFNSHYSVRKWVNGNLFSSGSGSMGSGYITFTTGNFVAPAGADVATWKFEWSGNVTGGGVAGFSIDDLFVRAVPEPTTLTGLVILLTGCISQRRSKR